MSWEVRQTRRFARTYKKLTNATLIADTDAAVATVAQDPDVGERKRRPGATVGAQVPAATASYTCWATRAKTLCSWFIWKRWDHTRILSGCEALTLIHQSSRSIIHHGHHFGFKAKYIHHVQRVGIVGGVARWLCQSIGLHHEQVIDEELDVLFDGSLGRKAHLSGTRASRKTSGKRCADQP